MTIGYPLSPREQEVQLGRVPPWGVAVAPMEDH
jgi:hypothetical protein